MTIKERLDIRQKMTAEWAKNKEIAFLDFGEWKLYDIRDLIIKWDKSKYHKYYLKYRNKRIEYQKNYRELKKLNKKL